MALEILSKSLNGLILFKPGLYRDERGFFMESYRKEDLENEGVYTDFVQDNHSLTKKNGLRGLHFQWDKPQGKLLRVTSGSAKFIEVDIRPGSPSFGAYARFDLSSDNKHVLWVPAGFANGFLALEDSTEVQYKCTSYWNPKAEGCIRWNDADIYIDWSISNPLVSDKDLNGMTLKQWLKNPASEVFSFQRICNLYIK